MPGEYSDLSNLLRSWDLLRVRLGDAPPIAAVAPLPDVTTLPGRAALAAPLVLALALVTPLLLPGIATVAVGVVAADDAAAAARGAVLMDEAAELSRTPKTPTVLATVDSPIACCDRKE